MIACAVALVLLMDVSASVSDENYALQRDGTADALVSRDVRRAVGVEGVIALTVIEWSTGTQTVVPWRTLASDADLAAAAADIRKVSRSGRGLTAVGKALDAGIEAFETTPCDPERKVIDVSGDGEDNVSGMAGARDRVVAAGIVVNGLPIVTAAEPKVADYYAEQVVTVGGFVLAAEGFEEFGQAMRRKLTYEISGRAPETRIANR